MPRPTARASSASGARSLRHRPTTTRCTGTYRRTRHSPSHRATSRSTAVSYTHLRAHETRHDLVCRLLLEKKNNNNLTFDCPSAHTIHDIERDEQAPVI